MKAAIMRAGRNAGMNAAQRHGKIVIALP